MVPKTTNYCLLGAIAEAFYGGVPDEIKVEVRKRLPKELWDVVARFSRKYL